MKKKQCDVFGERLATLRQEKKLTQAELSGILKIQRVTIAKYETGQRAPSIDHLIIFAEYFNASTDYLLGLTDIRNYNDKNMAIAYEYTGLSEESLEILNCLSEGKRLRKKLSMERYVEVIDIISSIIKYLNELPTIIYNIANAAFVNEMSDSDIDIASMLTYELKESHEELNKSNYVVLSGYRQKHFYIQEVLSDFELILKIIINEFAPKEFVREDNNLKIYSDLSLIAINNAENITLNDLILGKINNRFKEDSDNAQHNPKNE